MAALLMDADVVGVASCVCDAGAPDGDAGVRPNRRAAVVGTWTRSTLARKTGGHRSMPKSNTKTPVRFPEVVRLSGPRLLDVTSAGPRRDGVHLAGFHRAAKAQGTPTVRNADEPPSKRRVALRWPLSPRRARRSSVDREGSSSSKGETRSDGASYTPIP